jgi:uncharacterized protein YutE (UPF0331/DUF86 family)
VIYLNPSQDEGSAIARPTWQQIQIALREVESLAASKHYSAAIVAASAFVEALARLARASSDDQSSQIVSPLQAVQTLSEEGYIEAETAERLREFVRLRNAVVHGDLSAVVSPDQVDRLLKDVRNIASLVETIVHTS